MTVLLRTWTMPTPVSLVIYRVLIKCCGVYNAIKKMNCFVQILNDMIRVNKTLESFFQVNTIFACLFQSKRNLKKHTDMSN